MAEYTPQLFQNDCVSPLNGFVGGFSLSKPGLPLRVAMAGLHPPLSLVWRYFGPKMPAGPFPVVAAQNRALLYGGVRSPD